MNWLYPILFLIVFFMIFWIYGKKTDRYLVADFAWSLAIPLTMGLYMVLFSVPFHPFGWIWLAVSVWGLRLAYLLWGRVASGHEDRRYQNMKNAWGDAYPMKFIGFFMLQALVAWIFVAPFLPAMMNRLHTPWLVYTGLGLFAISLYLEWLADEQVRRFKKENDDPKGFCKEGLWKYSRHPNYFFEWFCWVGLALAATAFVQGYYAWITTAAELILILFFSGIPYTEDVMLESRGQAYQDYKEKTSAFVPWFPGSHS